MISHEHRIIFVHVPKTGGTSIEDALGLSGPRHATARQYRQHHPDIWSGYRTFGFVRNPWARVLSFYLYRRQVRRLAEALTGSFSEWLRQVYDLVLAGEVDRLNARFAPHVGVGTFVEGDRDGWRTKLGPAMHMLGDGHGDVLVDHVGRFERLAEDLALILRRCDLPPVTLPHRNHTEHGPYWEYYDETTRSIVADLCAEDIATFGYRFGEDHSTGVDITR